MFLFRWIRLLSILFKLVDENGNVTIDSNDGKYFSSHQIHDFKALFKLGSQWYEDGDMDLDESGRVDSEDLMLLIKLMNKDSLE